MPFQVDISSATFVIITTGVNDPARGLASTVMTASSFVSECNSSGNEMQATYGPESNNYKAGAYYSSGKVYLRSSSRYDGATLIVL